MTDNNRDGRRDLNEDLASLSNTDVSWQGTLVGAVPTIKGEAAQRLLQAKREAIPGLIDALADPSKFAAAHVILTLLSEVEYEASPWNGLRIDIGQDGAVDIDPAQQPAIHRQWLQWAESPANRENDEREE